MKDAFLDKSIPEHLVGKVTLEFLGFMSMAQNCKLIIITHSGYTKGTAVSFLANFRD
jgi:hypothetical protein